MFGNIVKSKKHAISGCLNCPSNKYKDKRFRKDFLLKENCYPDILFILTEDNEKLVELIEKHFNDRKIAISYLTKCDVPDLKPTSYPITCCKQQVMGELKSITPKIIVGFDSHFLTWLYGKYYDVRTWRGRLCPVMFNSKEVYQYTSLDFKIIEQLKFFEQKEAWYQIEVDFKNINKHLDNYKRPIVWEAGYENGIEIISGMEDGDFDKLEKELESLVDLPYVALDIENSPLKPWFHNQYYPDTIAMASIAIGTFDKVISFPLEHPKCWNGNYDKVLNLLEEFLILSGTKIAHNLKHELQWFYCYFGKEVLFETEWADTQALSYILHNVTSKEKNQGMHGLGKLTLAYYGFNLKDQREIDFRKIFDEPILDLLRYNGRDTKWEYKLYEDMLPLLDENQKRLFDFHNQDCKTWAIAESEGYKCDVDKLDEFKKKYIREEKSLKKQIFDLPELKGTTFDLTSPQQLSDVLIDKFDVKLQKSDKGNYIVDAKTLQQLSDKGNKLCNLLLPYRKVTKQLSTYVKGMYSVIHIDNNFHSDFNSYITVTGRKTSNNPNGQNFPKRGEGKEIREIVIPKKDCVIISVDFGQLEARGYCMVSNERSYIEKLKNGIDIHMEWAKRILELYPEAYTVNNEKDLKDYRGIVKNLHVFPSFYGAGVNSRANSLGLPIQLMEQIDYEFWSEFPRIRKWQEDTLEFYRKNGYIETLTGRKLRGKCPEKEQFKILLSMNDVFNYPVQGTCSDIVCDSANRLSQLSYEYNEPALQPQLNVHDDLTYTQVPKSNWEDYAQIIMKEMCRKTYDFIIDVPLQVELSMGENWADMEEVYVKDTRDFTY